jgi:hypothetical protein
MNGARSTSALGRAVVADALRSVDLWSGTVSDEQSAFPCKNGSQD